jgi:hypothetical protein
MVKSTDLWNLNNPVQLVRLNWSTGEAQALTEPIRIKGYFLILAHAPVIDARRPLAAISVNR